LRSRLHAIPELSGEEILTAEVLAAYARENGADEVITQLADRSLAVIINGKSNGKTLMLRCDIDAIPSGSSAAHLCGHDGHSAVMAGLIPFLKIHPPMAGRVILLFQAAEETGQGAKALLNDTHFLSMKPDFIIGMHNLPGFEKNSIVFKNNEFAMASNGVLARLLGKKCHAAEPEKGINPAAAVADFIGELQRMNESVNTEANFQFATITHIRVGETTFGTAAADAEIWITLRASTDRALFAMNKTLAEKLFFVSEKYGLGSEISVSDCFPATINHQECVTIIENAVSTTGLQINRLQLPFRWSEDFGHYSALAKSAMFGLGSGIDHTPLHMAGYEFPDEIIASGIEAFAAIIKQVNGL